MTVLGPISDIRDTVHPYQTDSSDSFSLSFVLTTSLRITTLGFNSLISQ